MRREHAPDELFGLLVVTGRVCFERVDRHDEVMLLAETMPTSFGHSRWCVLACDRGIFK